MLFRFGFVQVPVNRGHGVVVARQGGFPCTLHVSYVQPKRGRFGAVAYLHPVFTVTAGDDGPNPGIRRATCSARNKLPREYFRYVACRTEQNICQWNTDNSNAGKFLIRRTLQMAKKSRGGRMTAAKKRAAKRAGGKGPVKKRAVGRKIMRT